MPAGFLETSGSSQDGKGDGARAPDCTWFERDVRCNALLVDVCTVWRLVTCDSDSYP